MPDPPLKGFGGVAAFFASDPDHGSTIFRRFNRLALRNILHLQARLAALEQKQRQYDLEDSKTPGLRTIESTTSWIELSALASQVDGEREKKRVDLANEIQEAVKTYQEAIMLHSQVLSLPRPPDTTINAFKRYFQPGQDVTRLRKENRAYLDDIDDLASLRSASDHDRLTSFVLNQLGGAIAQTNGEHAIVRAKTLTRVVSIISTIVAAVMLVGAVATLNYAPSQWHILILACYTAGFGATVAMLTSASRAEIFTASCAYVAVLVVFVGTNGGNCDCPAPGS